VSEASAKAVEKIEAAGGSVESDGDDEWDEE
jgi:ribosomal protein L15